MSQSNFDVPYNGPADEGRQETPVPQQTKRCEIVSFMVPETPYFVSGGTGLAVHQCMTHVVHVSPGEELCVIGRIEEAVDRGIARINAALAEAGHGRGPT